MNRADRRAAVKKAKRECINGHLLKAPPYDGQCYRCGAVIKKNAP